MDSHCKDHCNNWKRTGVFQGRRRKKKQNKGMKRWRLRVLHWGHTCKPAQSVQISGRKSANLPEQQSQSMLHLRLVPRIFMQTGYLFAVTISWQVIIYRNNIKRMVCMEKVVETPELCKYIWVLYLPGDSSQRTPPDCSQQWLGCL